MIRAIGTFSGVLLAMTLLASSAHAQYDRGQNYREVRCESRDYRYQRCNVDWADARLVRQISSTPCRRGDTWGVDRRGLWVDRGCTGVFVQGGRPGRPGHGGGWTPGNDWDRDIRFTCQSQDFRYRLCQVDTGRGGDVRIERQLSKTACVRGQTWGFHRGGVWVDRGCAATFVVERRWR